MPPEPDFDGVNLPYGRDGEDYVQSVARLMVMPAEKGCEVKHKTYVDGSFYIETEQCVHGVWKPGGINATRAPLYGFVIANTGITIQFPSEVIREAIRRCLGRYVEETDGDNPTRGRLIDFQSLIRLGGEMKGQRFIREAVQARAV